MEGGAKVFVGGLSWDTTSEALRAYFEAFGEVLDAPIMRDRVTAKPRGFGFVVFRDMAVADRVVRESHTIDGRQVDAKWATPRDGGGPRPGGGGLGYGDGSAGPHGGLGGGPPPRSKKIFVGGLSPSMTEEAFRHYFEAFGPISDAVVMFDPNTHRPRGFGFVTFEAEESVEAVLRGGTMHALDGKQVEVKVAVPKDQIDPPRRPQSLRGGLGGGLGGGFMGAFGGGGGGGGAGRYGARGPPGYGGGYGMGLSSMASLSTALGGMGLGPGMGGPGSGGAGGYGGGPYGQSIGGGSGGGFGMSASEQAYGAQYGLYGSMVAAQYGSSGPPPGSYGSSYGTAPYGGYGYGVTGGDPSGQGPAGGAGYGGGGYGGAPGGPGVGDYPIGLDYRTAGGAGYAPPVPNFSYGRSADGPSTSGGSLADGPMPPVGGGGSGGAAVADRSGAGAYPRGNDRPAY